MNSQIARREILRGVASSTTRREVDMRVSEDFAKIYRVLQKYKNRVLLLRAFGGRADKILESPCAGIIRIRFSGSARWDHPAPSQPLGSPVF